MPWTFVYKLLCGHLFLILWGLYLGMELLDHMETNLISNFLRNRQTVFQSSCAVLRSQQHGVRVPVSPHLCQYLLVSLRISLLVGVKWYLIVVLPSCFFFFKKNSDLGQTSQRPEPVTPGSRPWLWELPLWVAHGWCATEELA